MAGSRYPSNHVLKHASYVCLRGVHSGESECAIETTFLEILPKVGTKNTEKALAHQLAYITKLTRHTIAVLD